MSSKVVVKKSKTHGRGVFATDFIYRGNIIEVCEIIFIPKKECSHIEKTVITNFYYQWNVLDGGLALGCGSLYNHSYSPNAWYFPHGDVLKIKARRDIAKGEEIFINYNGVPTDVTPVWFDTKKGS